MRSFGSLALKQVRARRLRAILTAAGIVLGVAMILGVLLLAATIHATFDDLFSSVYGRTDLVISGQGSDSLPHSALRTARRAPGVDQVSGQLFSVFTLIDRGGVASTDQSKQVNVNGESPNAANLSTARTVEGRKPRSGLELELQRSWADANDLAVGDRVSLATPAGSRRLRVVGLFQFTSGLDFGGQGFGLMPLASARRVMDKPRVFDEIDLAVGGGQPAIDRARRELDRRFGRGVEVQTPDSKSSEVESQLQAFNVVLYFFAAMALFVGAFLIFNSFNMTVFQRTREIGMLRTLGAGRGAVTGSVLREAAILGLVGGALGLGLGFALALGLIQIVHAVNIPVGRLRFESFAPIAAVATGLITAVLGALTPARRAGRIAPIRAVLGTEGLRARPRARRAVLGLVLIGAGLAGAFVLGAAPQPTAAVVVAGMGGVIAIFLGIALLAPFVVRPLVAVLGWPLRRAFPISGRLAADAARSDPARTAATANALMIGLALVVAVNSLGASFLKTISDEFDRSFARDLTVQPNGFAPGQGPQQTIAKGLRKRLARIPQAGVVASERFLFTNRLPGQEQGKKPSQGLLVAFDPSVYRKLDETKIDGASRSVAFRRMEQGQVTVGKGWADETGLGVGDSVRLNGPSGTVHTRVAGIVETVIFGGQTMGMSLETMRRVYGVTADSELALKATSDSASVRASLQRRVERVIHRQYPNLAVLSNAQLKSSVQDRVNQQFAIFYAIVGVAIFASLFGIINTLTMSVLERTREIGVLRALGASRGQVRFSITDESLVIGLIGALLGIAVGSGLGYALLQGLSAGVPGVEYRPPFSTMVAVAGAGLVLGLIASILPARRAARLDVIRAISYE